MSRRVYPSDEQVRRAAAQAKAVGISRVGALAVSPNGAIWIFDASLARRFAGEVEDGEDALARMEASVGVS